MKTAADADLSNNKVRGILLLKYRIHVPTMYSVSDLENFSDDINNRLMKRPPHIFAARWATKLMVRWSLQVAPLPPVLPRRSRTLDPCQR